MYAYTSSIVYGSEDVVHNKSLYLEYTKPPSRLYRVIKLRYGKSVNCLFTTQIGTNIFVPMPSKLAMLCSIDCDIIGNASVILTCKPLTKDTALMARRGLIASIVVRSGKAPVTEIFCVSWTRLSAMTWVEKNASAKYHSRQANTATVVLRCLFY